MREALTRRRALVGGGVVGGAGALWWLLSGRSSTVTDIGPWRMFQRDARNTGHDPGNTTPITKVTERWSVSVPKRGVLSTPAVADEQVYVTVAGDPGAVHAYDAATGDQLWHRRDVAMLEGSTPAIRDDRLYVAARGTVLVLSRRDGTVLQELALDAPTQHAVTIHRETAYVGTNAGTLHAFDTVTGELRWRAAPDVTRLQSAPAVTDDTVYATATGPNDERAVILAINRATGAVRWQYDLHTGTEIAPPTVVDGVVYVTLGDVGVFAISTDTNRDEQLLWHRDLGAGTLPSSPAVGPNTIVVNTGNLVAFNRDTGARTWTYSVSRQGKYNLLTPSPSIINGTVLSGTGSLNLYLIELTTGREIDVISTDDVVLGSVSCGAEGVYFGTGSRLYAMAARG